MQVNTIVLTLMRIASNNRLAMNISAVEFRDRCLNEDRRFYILYGGLSSGLENPPGLSSTQYGLYRDRYV